VLSSKKKKPSDPEVVWKKGEAGSPPAADLSGDEQVPTPRQPTEGKKTRKRKAKAQKKAVKKEKKELKRQKKVERKNTKALKQTLDKPGMNPSNLSQFVVFTDIDDTCYPTKCKSFYLREESGCFPGMADFLLAISRGRSHQEAWPINVLSARDGKLLPFLKIKEKSRLGKALAKAGGSLGTVLYGKITDQKSIMWGKKARKETLAERKARNMANFMRVLTKDKRMQLRDNMDQYAHMRTLSDVDEPPPSMKEKRLKSTPALKLDQRSTNRVKRKLQAIFCGDDGEGDLLAADYMIENFEGIKAVFIHKVQYKFEEKNTKASKARLTLMNKLSERCSFANFASLEPDSPRPFDNRPQLFLYDNVAEASILAYQNEIISLTSLSQIYQAILQSSLYRKNRLLDPFSAYHKPGGDAESLEKQNSQETLYSAASDPDEEDTDAVSFFNFLNQLRELIDEELRHLTKAERDSAIALTRDPGQSNMDIFKRLLSPRHPQVIISTRSDPARSEPPMPLGGIEENKEEEDGMVHIAKSKSAPLSPSVQDQQSPSSPEERKSKTYF